MWLICELQKMQKSSETDNRKYNKQLICLHEYYNGGSRLITEKHTWALAFKIRLSVRSHFTRALSLPSVRTLPISINFGSRSNDILSITQKVREGAHNSSIIFANKHLKRVSANLWIQKVSAKLIMCSRNFNNARRLWRNFRWSHKNTGWKLWHFVVRELANSFRRKPNPLRIKHSKTTCGLAQIFG